MIPLLNKFKRKRLVFIVVYSAVFLSLASSIPTIRKPILNALKPGFGLFNLLRREIGGILFYHRNLIQNEKSKSQIEALRLKLNAMEEYYLENKRLRNLLSFKEQSPYKLVASRIIGRSPDNWSTVIIIDKGRHHGIRKSMAVISALGLLGRVVEDTLYLSKIMLINDPNFAVSGIVQRSRQEGLICGTVGDNLLMKYLPKDADINIQDTVITSGFTPAYPKGILIGKVVDIGDEFSGLTRYAVLKPAVNLSNIEEVFVIIQSEK